MSKKQLAFIFALIIALIIVATFFIVGCNQSATKNNLSLISKTMKLTSPAFKNNQNLSVKYTCDGSGVNPPLIISEAPADTQSFVLIVNDPDAPSGDFVHWLVWNIDSQTTEIAENDVPTESVEGMTDYNHCGYGPPCPPSGTHRYYFRIYALDTKFNLLSETRKPDLLKVMQGHILDQAELIGLYSRGQ